MTVIGKMDLLGVETTLKSLEEGLEFSPDEFVVEVSASKYRTLCAALLHYAEKYDGYQRHSPEILTAMCFISNNDEELH